MMWAVQASRRAWSAVIRSPVEVVATPASVEQGVEVEGDHHAGGGAAVLGQAGVGEVLEQGAERLASASGDGQGVDLAQPLECHPAWGGVGVEVGAEPVGDVVGEPGEQVGGSVAAGLEGEFGGGVGAALLGDQPFVLGLVGDVGGDGFEQPVAEAAQLAGPERGGLLDQVLPRPGHAAPGSRSAGSASSAATMTWAWAMLTRPSSSAAPRMPAAVVDRGGEPGGPQHGAVVVAGGVGQPGGGGPGAGLDGDVVGGGEDAELEGLHPEASLVSSTSAVCFCFGGHEHRLHDSHFIERGADGFDAAQHRVRSGVGDRRHGSSQASTTDSERVVHRLRSPYSQGI